MTVGTDDSRKRIRQIFTEYLQSGMAELGVPAGHITPSRVVNPKGRSPLVFVTSDGSERPRLTVRSHKGMFNIAIFNAVLLTDPKNEAWTEELAEALLDDMEGRIPTILEAHKSFEGLWSSVEYREASLIERVDLSGSDYLIEYIPLVFTKG